MAKSKKMNNEEVANVVCSEGLGYAITGYMSADRIADPKLAKMWAEAKDVLTRIEVYLEPFETGEC